MSTKGRRMTSRIRTHTNPMRIYIYTHARFTSISKQYFDQNVKDHKKLITHIYRCIYRYTHSHELRSERKRKKRKHIANGRCRYLGTHTHSGGGGSSGGGGHSRNSPHTNRLNFQFDFGFRIAFNGRAFPYQHFKYAIYWHATHTIYSGSLAQSHMRNNYTRTHAYDTARFINTCNSII